MSETISQAATGSAIEPIEASSNPIAANAEAFSFGEPESVIDRREIFDLCEVYHNNLWYEPPVSLSGIGRAYRMAAQHQSAIVFKRNLLSAAFVPSSLFPRQEFARWALDWLVFGNAYIERVRNARGGTVAIKTMPAAFMRKGLKGEFYWSPRAYAIEQAIKIEGDRVHHLLEPDPMQEIYGLPEYLSALQSGLLNESATLFRRRYYLNGAHAGFVMYISEENLDNASSDAIREAMKGAKGPGNFRNLYLHIPKGKPEGVKVLPIAEVGAKDEFLNIKETTSQDLLAAHRIPPQLIGIVPKNAGGFGNVKDAAAVFYELEIVPIQRRMLELNDWLGIEAIKFERPAIAIAEAEKSAA